MSDDPEDEVDLAISRTITDALPLSLGDRVAIERRIDRFESRVEQHISERDKQASSFYQTRMMPLEAKVERNTRLVWFGLGVASATLIISAIEVVTSLMER